MITRIVSLRNHFAALLLGTLLTLSFAPYELFPLAILSPAGLWLLWRNLSPGKAFLCGFFFGVGFFGTGVSWVFISIYRFGGVSFSLAVLITAMFVSILAIFPASVGYLIRRYFSLDTRWQMLGAFPALWVLSEWARSWIFTGFPWLFIGYSQTHTSLKGYAPLLSVYGVSLVTILSSALLARGYLFWQQKRYQSCYYQGLILLIIWIMGGLLALIPWTKGTDRPLSVSLVQGNIPQQLKWSASHIQLSLDRYKKLTQPLWSKSQLIIWPEAAIPTTLQAAAGYIDHLNQQAMQHHTTLLLGIPIEKDDSGYFNSIISLGEKQQLYIKRQLVPFGEFIPSNKLLTILFSTLDIPMSNMLPGQRMQEPFIVNGIKILPSICYEIAFPALMHSNDKDIGLLLTITNDAWFGQSIAQAQHLQIAAMRGVELARPVLFVSNNGITAILDSAGNVVKQLPSDQTAVLTGTVQPRKGLTPWMRNGMSPLLFILCCLLYLAK